MKYKAVLLFEEFFSFESFFFFPFLKRQPILSVFVYQASKSNEFICFCPKRENDNYLS